MPTLVVDYDVEVASIVLKKKRDGATLTVNVSTEYWPANGLYSGSPIFYPLLVSFPQNKRGVGNTTAIRYDVTLDVDTKSPMGEYGKGFVDLLDEYDIHGALVTLFYYPKPFDGATTSASANTRQTLECVGLDYDDGSDVCSIQCKDTWFKDGQFSRDFLAADFLGNTLVTDYYKNNWLGDIKPVTFGSTTDGVLSSSCPIVESTLETDGLGTYQFFKVYAGLTNADNGGASLTKTYIKNQFTQISPVAWFPLDAQSTSRLFASPAAGPTTLVNATLISGQTFKLARIVTPPSGFCGLYSGATVRMKRIGVIGPGEGKLELVVYLAKSVSVNNWAIEGSPLMTAQLDPAAIATSETNYQFFFQEMLPLPGGRDYFFIVQYTNKVDTANTIQFIYNSAVVVDPCFTNNQTLNENSWAQTAAQAQIQVWRYLIQSTVGYSAGAYLNFYLEVRQAQRGANPFLFQNNDFKLALSGLTDTVAGLYTGVGNAIIDSPVDIINYALQSVAMGAGVAPAGIDSASFVAARAILGSHYDMSFTYESDLSVSELLEKVCRQGRVTLYKKRDGKLAVWAANYVGVTSVVIDEGRLQGEMQLINVADIDYDQIVNFLEAVYNYDALQQNTDPALLRISRDTKFLGLEYTYATDMGFSAYDARRVAQSFSSRALYGDRELLVKCDLHQLVGPVRRLLDYLGDRFAYPQKRVALRILRSKWYSSIDLFDTIQISHTGVQAASGTAYTLRVHTDGTPLTSYEGGIPLNSWAGGNLLVQVQEIAEEGPWMSLIGEVINPY